MLFTNRYAKAGKCEPGVTLSSENRNREREAIWAGATIQPRFTVAFAATVGENYFPNSNQNAQTSAHLHRNRSDGLSRPLTGSVPLCSFWIEQQ
jgi:hypothetical protein